MPASLYDDPGTVYGTALYDAVADPEPLGPSNLRIDIFYSGEWHEVTDDRRMDADVQCQRGRGSEDDTASPASASFSLDNETGTYSPRNPNSPLYGLIGRNTPVRIGLGRPPIARVATGSGGTDITAPAYTAEVAGASLAFWVATPSGAITPAAGYASLDTSGVNLSSNLGQKTGVAAGAVSAAVATKASVTDWAAVHLHVPGSSGATASFDLSSGLGGSVAVSTSSILEGDTVIAFCVWSADAANRMQPPAVIGNLAADWVMLADTGPSSAIRVQAWSATWQADADGESIALVGPITVADAATIYLTSMGQCDAYAARFTGEIAEWPTSWGKAGNNVRTSITAGGALRRLVASEKGSGVSAIRRTLLSRSEVVHYWPLEDEAGSPSFAPATQGSEPMRFQGVPELAASEEVAGSLALPTFTSAGARANVTSFPPQAAADSAACVGCVAKIPLAGTAVGANIAVLSLSGGTINTLGVEYTSATTVTFKVTYADGSIGSSVIDVSADIPTLLDSVVLVTVGAEQDGVDVVLVVVIADVTPGRGSTGAPDGTTFNATLTTETLGTPSQAEVGIEVGTGATLHTNAIVLGHAFVAAAASLTYDTLTYGAFRGYQGYVPTDRLIIAARDAGVPLGLAVQDVDVEVPMGSERVGTLYEKLAAIERTDRGILCDAPGFVGVQYRTMDHVESNGPILTFDYEGGVFTDPFEPTDDERGLVNDATVSRADGGSARSEVLEGPLNTAEYPNGVGRYAVQVNAETFTIEDSQSLAEWISHVGTFDGARWPILALGLMASTAAGTRLDIPRVTVGDTVRIVNLPSFGPPGPVDLIVVGIRDTIGVAQWIVELDCIPADPWRVLYPGTEGFDVIGLARGAALTDEALDATETGVDVAIASGSLYSTAAAAVPFDVVIGGERMTVTAVTGASSPQTLTVTRSVNGIVKSHATGSEVEAVASYVAK